MSRRKSIPKIRGWFYYGGVYRVMETQKMIFAGTVRTKSGLIRRQGNDLSHETQVSSHQETPPH